MYQILLDAISVKRFGHVTSKCKHNEVCASCSETGDIDTTCTKAFKCVNCEENHITKSVPFISENI